MPCVDGREHDLDSSLFMARQRADLNARVACEVLRKMEEAHPWFIGGLSKEAQDWWRHHKEADRRREAAERRREKDEVKRARAIAKLTPEERTLLGLRSD